MKANTTTKLSPARKVALLGALGALALIFGYIESLFPINIGVPGIKLGLSNIVVLFALCTLGAGPACLLAALKVLLSGLLFSGPSAMLYSLAGAALSLGVMLPLRRVRAISIVGVSIAGGVFHNVGQLLMAALILKSPLVLYYAPALMLSGAATGALTGFLTKLASRLVPSLNAQVKTPAPEESQTGTK